jgi:N6-L-threonylcarbamoyladenine synthase
MPTEKRLKYILGIETSCDDTSIAIMSSGDEKVEILSHVSFSQEEILSKWGGVVPELAARNHLEKITPLLSEASEIAKIRFKDIDLIGVTTKPGLLGPLLTGLNAAKTLSLVHQLPIYPVNHLYAHLEAIHIDQEVNYPYLGLLVSGGHSIYFWVTSTSEFEVIASTIDDAAGEAFDKGGKILGLGYPAGRIIDELSLRGDKTRFKFPVGLLGSKDAKLSFSGVKTSMRVFLEKNPEIKIQEDFNPEVVQEKYQDIYDTCASYQEAIVSALSRKLGEAIKIVKERYKPSSISIVVGGGVACNSALRSTLTDRNHEIHFVSPKYCTDNGAMVANLARLNFQSSLPYPECLDMDASGRFIKK